MTDRELMQQALDALEKVWLLGDGAASMVNPVIAELRARLTEPDDTDLCRMLRTFYHVETNVELIAAQDRHIEKLQAKIPPHRDDQPKRVREG